MIRRPPGSTRTDTLFPYTTLFRSQRVLNCTQIGCVPGESDRAGAIGKSPACLMLEPGPQTAVPVKLAPVFFQRCTGEGALFQGNQISIVQIDIKPVVGSQSKRRSILQVDVNTFGLQVSNIDKL